MNSKWLKRGMVVLAAAVALYTILLLASGLALRKAYAGLKADNRPMTLDEILPPAVADQDNAALLYRSADLVLKANGLGNMDFCRLMETNQAEAGAVMGSPAVVQALDLVRAGAGRKGYRSEVDYSKGAEMILPHLAGMRTLERLQAARVKELALKGDHAGAWEAAELGYRLADALRTEPTVISQLVRFSMFGIIDQAVLDLCRASPPTAAMCEKIGRLVEPFENTTISMAMDGERLAFGEWFFLQPAETMLKGMEVLNGDAERVRVRPFLCKAPVQFMHASYLNHMRIMAELMEKPYAEASQTAFESKLDDIPRWDFLSRMLLPAYGGVKVKYVAVHARASLTRTAMALFRHRLAHQAFPASLAECDPKFLAAQPVDPFVGQPLLYRQEAGGFLLYSTGENMKDDGGKAEPTHDAKRKLPEKERSAKAWDIVWKYVSDKGI